MVHKLTVDALVKVKIRPICALKPKCLHCSYQWRTEETSEKVKVKIAKISKSSEFRLVMLCLISSVMTKRVGMHCYRACNTAISASAIPIASQKM